MEVDGTQAKRQKMKVVGAIPSTVNQASPMPNPAKPAGWCDWCNMQTGNKFSETAAAPFCATCSRIKN